MGMAGDELAAALNDQVGPAEFALFVENAPALDAFALVHTQWRTVLVPAGMGAASRPAGLDYVAVKVLLDAFGVPLDRELAHALRLIEGAILKDMHDGEGR